MMIAAQSGEQMAGRGPGSSPGWVQAILGWTLTWPLARAGLTSPFLVAAATELLDFPAAVQVQDSVGLHPGTPWAILNIIIQVFGSLIVLSGRMIWLGAGMLGGYTCVTAVLAHQFWRFSGHAAFEARNEFFDDLSMVAGFVVAALYVDCRQRRLSVIAS